MGNKQVFPIFCVVPKNKDVAIVLVQDWDELIGNTPQQIFFISTEKASQLSQDLLTAIGDITIKDNTKDGKKYISSTES
jgi:hypothetical protein